MLHSSAEFIDLQRRNSDNAQTTTAKQRSSITSAAWHLRSRKTPQNFSGEVVQPLTSGWILLPAAMKCKRVVSFSLTIFYIVPRERPGKWRSGCLRHELTAINPTYETLPTGHRSRS